MERTKSFMDVILFLPFTNHFSFYHFHCSKPLNFLRLYADFPPDDLRSEIVERSEGIFTESLSVELLSLTKILKILFLSFIDIIFDHLFDRFFINITEKGLV